MLNSVLLVVLEPGRNSDKSIGNTSKFKPSRLKYFTLPQTGGNHKIKMLDELGDIRDLTNTLEIMEIDLS
jgi:hypothetical protein